MKILILEDDLVRVAYFRQVLYGHEIIHVEHAKDAIELLSNTKFDYIFLDHDLGGMQMEYDKEDCGTVVAEFMQDNNITTPTIIHSFNSPAAHRMLDIIPHARYLPGCWHDKNLKVGV